MMEKTNLAIYWSMLNHEEWSLYVAATANGLCYVGDRNTSLDVLRGCANHRFPGSVMIQDDEKLKPYALELTEYFRGKRTAFTLPVDIRGTSFQLAVWNKLCEIPYGETRSYKDIADLIQKPAAVRAVGAAVGANPVLITVPCHRVIGKNGSLTGYRGGLEMKTSLLRLERKSTFA